MNDFIVRDWIPYKFFSEKFRRVGVGHLTLTTEKCFHFIANAGQNWGGILHWMFDSFIFNVRNFLQKHIGFICSNNEPLATVQFSKIANLVSQNNTPTTFDFYYACNTAVDQSRGWTAGSAFHFSISSKFWNPAKPRKENPCKQVLKGIGSSWTFRSFVIALWLGKQADRYSLKRDVLLQFSAHLNLRYFFISKN